MSEHNVIVIGASAGGVEALSNLVRALPADLAAALLVVIHIPAQGKSMMPMILSRVGKLKAVHPQEGQTLQPGHIYIAPPDYHLLVKHDSIRLARGPRENGHRPAIDPLFRTAARVYGARVVGVILSGTLDDGVAGLGAIKQQGGIAIVQDPEEALYDGMPLSAIANVEVDQVLPTQAIAALLVKLTQEPVTKPVKAVPDQMEIEADMATLETEALQRHQRPGQPSGFGCPECGGALWELEENPLIRFRCRVGHAYSAESLLAEQSEDLEVALWSGLRALEEQATLAQRLADRAHRRNQKQTAIRFEARAQEAQASATVLRQLLLKDQASSTPPAPADDGMNPSKLLRRDLD